MRDRREGDTLERAAAPRPTLTAGEPLFEFVRTSDPAPMSCKLRFHADSYGSEAELFLPTSSPIVAARFLTRALAVRRAELQHDAAKSGR